MAKQLTSKDDPKEAQNEGITAISVQGFKSLAKESRIEIRPLTILAGANSSGKSSIMQPLLLMKQTLEASYDPGPLLLNGPNAKFTSVNQFISRSQRNSDRQAFSVEVETDKERKYRVAFSITENQTIEIRDMVVVYDGDSLRLTPDQSADEIKKAVLKLFSEGIKEIGYFQKSLIKSLYLMFTWKLKLKLVVVRNRCFLDVIFGSADDIPFHKIMSVKFFSFVPDKELRRMIHVPGLRGNPERVYNRTVTGPDFPGIFEHYVATIIAQWQKKKDDRLQALETMLAALGLTQEISAKVVNDTQIELQVGRLPKAERDRSDLVNIADVGFGVSQVLPVLVALWVAKKGQLVYLEQPELHLHPRAQYALAKILAETAKRGVKLVVETHSALLLRQVQTLMAKGDIDPDLVKLHWFSRNPEDGTTSIRSADLDENGAFGDWPEDFGDVELKAEGAYLDAVEERGRE